MLDDKSKVGLVKLLSNKPRRNVSDPVAGNKKIGNLNLRLQVKLPCKKVRYEDVDHHSPSILMSPKEFQKYLLSSEESCSGYNKYEQILNLKTWDTSKEISNKENQRRNCRLLPMSTIQDILSEKDILKMQLKIQSDYRDLK